MTDRVFIATDPADLKEMCDTLAMHGSMKVQPAVTRVRADYEQRFGVEDIKAEVQPSEVTASAWFRGRDYVLDVLARRLQPPVQHKMTLRLWDRERQAPGEVWSFVCACGWSTHALTSDNPFGPSDRARAHLAENGGG